MKNNSPKKTSWHNLSKPGQIRRGFLRFAIISICTFRAFTASAQCTNTTLDLWKGESNVLDTVGMNNGAIVGTVTYATGVSGSAFLFNGSSSYLDFGPTAGNFGTNDFTIDFWLKTTNSSETSLLGKRSVCNAESMWDIRMEPSGKITFETCNDTGGTYYTAIHSAGTVNDGSFHEITTKRQGPVLSVFIDGRLDSQVTAGGISDISNSTDMVAGLSACVGVDGTGYLTGLLDEIKLGSACPCTSTVWDFWQGEDNTDDSAGPNNGTITGSVSYTTGESGDGFSFDGSSSYIDFGSSAGNFGTNDFTIDFWINTTSSSESSILGKRSVCDADNMWDIRLTPDGTFSFEIAEDGGGTYYTDCQSIGAVNDGFFHEITITRIGLSITTYIDGVLDNQVIASGLSDINNGYDLIAGRSACVGVDGTDYFTGVLDQIKFMSPCQ